jgi:hydroxymethylbilane synthase
LELLHRLEDQPSRRAVLAERAFLRTLGGGCLVPIGALAVITGTTLTLRGAVLPPDGRQRVAGEIAGPSVAAEEVGQRLALELLERGARDLLR